MNYPYLDRLLLSQLMTLSGVDRRNIKCFNPKIIHYQLYYLYIFILNHKSYMAKFDWIPYLQGKYLTYYEWFGVIGSTAMFILSFLSFFVYLVLCKFKIHEEQIIMNSRKTIIDKLKNIAFNMGFIFLSFIPLICSALDIIYLIQGAIGMSSILILLVFLDNGRTQWDNRYNYNRMSNVKTFVVLAFKLSLENKKKMIKLVIFSILATLFMYKTCLCFYNQQIGYYNHLLGFGINTYFTRLFQVKRACPPGPPCQLYATIPEDPAHAFFLNVHTHEDVSNVVVYYREVNSPNVTDFLIVNAESYEYHGLEWKERRKVHSALILGLKPNTKYLTIVSYNNQNYTNAIYKTLPDDPSTPVRMINAGDSGYTAAAIKLSKIVSTLNPDVFFMGGDIAYDDNMPACAYTWDYFLGMYGRITATLGYLMPIVATVGNHDVGLNELPGINITVDNYGPAYFLYFPQHFDRTEDYKVLKRVPPLKNRKTFLEFTFSNVHYVCLDSGYIHLFHKFQKSFLVDSFERNKNKMKFVNYHVPIFSVCERFDRNPQRFLFALFHWVPNFDKYKIMTVFENHVHSFKRTTGLTGNTPSDNGTVYVGDGAYGAIRSEFCKPDATMDIFEAFQKENNFWFSEIYSDRVEHVAYATDGRVLDKFTQYASAYQFESSDKVREEEITSSRQEIKAEQILVDN